MATLRRDGQRLSLRQLRAAFSPRAFAEIDVVSVESMGHQVQVEVLQLPDGGCRGGIKRWMVCPACGRKTLVLWCWPASGWGCRRCGGGHPKS